MPLNLLFAAFLVTAAQAAPLHPAVNMPALDPLEAEARCPETPMSLARKRAERPILRRLDQLPPAQAFAAVDRRIARCPTPMLLPLSP